ncbi:MAG: ion transporter [Pseudomonadota bacterium]
MSGREEAVRRRLYRQLDLNAWTGPGFSPLNLFLAVAVFASVVIAALLTERALAGYSALLHWLLGGLAVVFSVEYAGRFWTRWEDPDWRARPLGPWGYPFHSFALLDLAALIGLWLEVLIGAGIGWAVMLRLARLLRVFALDSHSALGQAARELSAAMGERRLELGLAASFAAAALLFVSTGIYIAERQAQPEAFGSIPRSAWWAVVTMTTVGYGDVTPVTATGKVIASVAALMSVGLIAVPAGIMAAAFSEAVQRVRRERAAQHRAARRPGPALRRRRRLRRRETPGPVPDDAPDDAPD